MILKIGALKNFVVSEKHLCWSLFILKLQTWRLATLLKRDSNTGVFQWILRNVSTVFSMEHLKWLLLSLQSIYVFTIPSSKGLEVWIWYGSWFFSVKTIPKFWFLERKLGIKAILVLNFDIFKKFMKLRSFTKMQSWKKSWKIPSPVKTPIPFELS